MKISCRELEHIRPDPGKWLRNTFGRTNYFPFSKYKLWQLAIKHYHDSGGNALEAIEYYDDEFRKRFVINPTNEKILESYLESLSLYFESFEGVNSKVIKTNHILKIDAGHDIYLGGYLNRLDLAIDGGFTGYFFEKQYNPNWVDELRMPLVQRGIADELMCDIKDVRVGVFILETGEHLTSQYSKAALNRAHQEMDQIAATLNQTLAILKKGNK